MQAVALSTLLLLIGLLTVEGALTDDKPTGEQGCSVGDELPVQVETGNIRLMSNEKLVPLKKL